MHYYAVIFPPSTVARTLDPLRGRYDPRTARVIRGHVTLAGPMLQADLAPFVNRLTSVAGKTRPFTLHLGEARRWPHVVYLPVLEASRLRNLRRRLGFSLRFGSRPWVPHLTLTEYLDKEATGRASRAMRGMKLAVRFTVKHVTLVRVPFRARGGYGKATLRSRVRFAGRP